jgi:lipopolysaccharide/colanic/teichoic acid biosynthesis glycosyltransferase
VGNHDRGSAGRPAGLTRGLGQARLIELAKNLDLLHRFTPDDAIEAAVNFCCHEPEGILGMLVIEELPEGERRLRANSVLVRASEASGQQPVAMSLDTWEKIAKVLAEDQWSCVQIARAAWLQSIGKDPPHRALMEFALEVLWSDEARLAQDSKAGRIGIDLAAALIEELERSEDSQRPHQQPFGLPAPLPAPNRKKVEEVIDRRGVTGTDNLFEPALPAYWNPPPFYANRGKRNALRFALLVGMDLFSASVGIAAGTWVANRLLTETESLVSILRGGRVAVPLLIVLFAYLGLYRPDSKRAKVAEIVKGMSIVAFVVALVALLEGFEPPVLLLILFCGIGASFTVWLSRALYDWGSVKWVKRRELRARTLFVAPADTAHLTADLVRQTSRRPMQFIGFVSREDEPDPSQLSTLGEFKQVLEEFFVDHVILADPELPLKRRSELAAVCHSKGVRLELFPFPDEIFQEGGEALADLSVPLITIPPPYLPRFSARFKLYFDLIVGGVLGIIVAPMLALLTGILFCANVWRSPIVKVPRLGRKTVGFSMYRLELQADNSVAEFLNALLVRTHLDELPQLYNVLRGEMSLVGPRPLDDREFSQLGEVQRSRYAVKPGITGLWQVNRRNQPVRDEFARIALMASLDLVYCRRWSPLLDFTILLRTPWAFFRAAEPNQEKG